MHYDTSTTNYNCGIDLHARQMYFCLMDRQGNKLARAVYFMLQKGRAGKGLLRKC